MTLPPGQMTIEVHSYGDGCLVAVTGEVDLLTAPDLVAAVDHALNGRPPWIVVDLTKVTFLASAGLQALVLGARQAQPDAGFVVVATGIAARPILLTRLDEAFAVYPDRASALADTRHRVPKPLPAPIKEPVAQADRDNPRR